MITALQCRRHHWHVHSDVFPQHKQWEKQTNEQWNPRPQFSTPEADHLFQFIPLHTFVLMSSLKTLLWFLSLLFFSWDVHLKPASTLVHPVPAYCSFGKTHLFACFPLIFFPLKWTESSCLATRRPDDDTFVKEPAYPSQNSLHRFRCHLYFTIRWLPQPQILNCYMKLKTLI